MARTPVERLILVGILCTAAFVRLYRIDLTWYFLDQVRDVSTAIGIASAKTFPLVGPLIGWTSGRLGPLYFYLIAPPFAITHDPIAGFVFVALANVLAVFLCYRFTRDYFGTPVALVASALFAAFPLGVFSSRVLWNPGLVPLFTLLFMRALFAVVVAARSRAIIWLFASLAILTQIHLTTAALGVVAVLALLVWRPRVRAVDWLAGLGAFLLLYAPYLAYELSHRFENVRAILLGVGTAEAGHGERAFVSLVTNLLVLYRPAIDGFVVADPWPRLFLDAFSFLYRVEALLFSAGVALCLWRLVRDRRATTPSAIAARKSIGLLLFWLVVPVALLGTRQTALWWYYFDLLYPSQFIFAGMALCALAWVTVVPARARRALAWGAGGLVLLVIVSQVWFQVGLQQRIERQGRFVFDVPKFSVASAGSALGLLPSLPYGYRARLLRTLVADFGMPADAFARRVHGPVLGHPDENDHLLRHVAARAGHDPRASAPPDIHYLVTDAAKAGAGLDPLRSKRIGPYTVIEYRPTIEYRSWRCALAPRESADGAPTSPWEPLAMPVTGVALPLAKHQVLVCEGALRIPEAKRTIEIAVSLIGPAPLQVVRGESQGRQFAPIAHRAWQSPSLYWATEAVFALAGLRPGPGVFRFAVAGTGPITGIDVYEQSAR